VNQNMSWHVLICARVQISAYMHAVLVHTAGPAERKGKVGIRPNHIFADTLTLFQPEGILCPSYADVPTNV
jgi:hypothetical protein